MNLLNSKRWILGGGLLLLSGVSLAGVSGANNALAPGENLGVSGEIDPAKLTSEETLSRSRTMLTAMQTTETRVASLQKRAEGKKDMVQVNCTSDKLVQVRGYVVVGTQAATAIDGAVQRNDVDGRVHGFERQTIVYQKVLVLGTEAEGCIGEDVSYIGATQVVVEIDSNIPQDDPTYGPVVNVIPLAPRPPEASPFI